MILTGWRVASRLAAAKWLGVLLPVTLSAQIAIPVAPGRHSFVLPPAVDSSAATVAFGANLVSDGSVATNADVYVAAADGSHLRRLVRPPNGTFAVTLSPDGARLAYTTQTLAGALTPGFEVHVVDVASGSDRTVDTDREGCIQPACVGCSSPCLHEPHFTADGAKVIFAASRNQPFYVVNSDGTGAANLPVYSGALAAAPARIASRNGLVVFTSSAPFGPTFAAAGTDAFTMNVDGTNIRSVTHFSNNASLYARNAVISADGATIAFESNYAGAGNPPAQTSQIWVTGADGSNLRQLTSGSSPAANPTLSADGSTLAFVQNGQILVVRTDGTGLKPLSGFTHSVAQDPVISDNGAWVVFSIGPTSGLRAAIYAAAADGSSVRTVYAPPGINPLGVTSAAGDAAASPGSLASVYGSNFGPDTLAVAAGFPLPQSLAGVSLLVNGKPVPILAVSPWQINAQIPPDLPAGTASFQVLSAGTPASAPVSATIQAISPAIFALPDPSANSVGVYQAAVLHAGSALLCNQANPAAAGDIVEIYGTGLGATNPPVPVGQAATASPLSNVPVPPDVLIGQTTAQVLFAGLTPGLAGVYQVNARIPAGLAPGRYAINWRVGGTLGASAGTITIR